MLYLFLQTLPSRPNTRFTAASDFGARKKAILTLPVQFSPPHAGKGQIPHSPGTEDSQMPGLCPGWGGMLKFRFDRRINSAMNQQLHVSHTKERKKGARVNRDRFCFSLVEKIRRIFQQSLKTYRTLLADFFCRRRKLFSCQQVCGEFR